MWHDFLVAVSLVLVIEGIMPFLSPANFRQTLQKILLLDDASIRTLGLLTMLLGVCLLYWVN
jgi:uncharacterized protein